METSPLSRASDWLESERRMRGVQDPGFVMYRFECWGFPREFLVREDGFAHDRLLIPTPPPFPPPATIYLTAGVSCMDRTTRRWRPTCPTLPRFYKTRVSTAPTPASPMETPGGMVGQRGRRVRGRVGAHASREPLVSTRYPCRRCLRCRL